MTRGAKSRSGMLCACVAALLLLAPTHAPAAGPSAVEEYVLTLPGVDSNEIGQAPIVTRSQRVGPIGVTGEDEDSLTPLGAISSAAVTPAGLILVAALAGGIVFALGWRGRQPR